MWLAFSRLYELTDHPSAAKHDLVGKCSMVWFGAQEKLRFTASYGDRLFSLAATCSHISKIALTTVIDITMEFDVGQGLGAPTPQQARYSCDKW